MLINRRDLLTALESVLPGTNNKESVEQSTCFCFTPGMITTFNDEILCTHDTPLEITGAVPFRPLLEILRKLTEEEVTVTATEKEFRIKGAGRRSVVRLSPDIVLPTGTVETPTEYRDLCPAFGDALSMVTECAAKEHDRFELNCVHFQPRMLEACDELQMMLYKVETGVSQPCLLRRQSCNAVSGLGVAAMAETENWIHWKTYSGLRVAVRKYLKEYPDLMTVVKADKVSTINLPPSIVEALDRASPFMQNTVNGKVGIVDLKPGNMRIRSLNSDGWYEETREVEYSGPEVSFGVNPKNATNLVKFGLPVELTENAIRIKGNAFLYALALENTNG